MTISSPIDDSYGFLRHGWWLATDRAFKGGAGRDRAQAGRAEEPHTAGSAGGLLEGAADCRRVELCNRPRTAWDPWTERVTVAVGDMFSGYPEIISSSGQFRRQQCELLSCTTRKARSCSGPSRCSHVQMQAAAFAPDGSMVRDSAYISAERRRRRCRRAGTAEDRRRQSQSNVRALAKAPVGEPLPVPCCSRASPARRS